jgi:hypothetical protein
MAEHTYAVRQDSTNETNINLKYGKEARITVILSPSSTKRCIALFSSSIACMFRPAAERDLSSEIN